MSRQEMNEVTIFINRLKKIGIELELAGNYPWIYLEKVNGNRVQPEDWINANHGYAIAYSPVRPDQDYSLDHDWKEMFRIIRKYK
jgi:hypothetical protein